MQIFSIFFNELIKSYVYLQTLFLSFRFFHLSEVFTSFDQVVMKIFKILHFDMFYSIHPCFDLKSAKTKMAGNRLGPFLMRLFGLQVICSVCGYNAL